MTDTIEAQTIYCPECDEDYAIAWSDDKGQAYVTCGCGEAEKLDDFLDRFREEHGDQDPEASMFQ